MPLVWAVANEEHVQFYRGVLGKALLARISSFVCCRDVTFIEHIFYLNYAGYLDCRLLLSTLKIKAPYSFPTLDYKHNNTPRNTLAQVHTAVKTSNSTWFRCICIIKLATLPPGVCMVVTGQLYFALLYITVLGQQSHCRLQPQQDHVLSWLVFLNFSRLHRIVPQRQSPPFWSILEVLLVI
jgi:hypothetical protein